MDVSLCRSELYRALGAGHYRERVRKRIYYGDVVRSEGIEGCLARVTGLDHVAAPLAEEAAVDAEPAPQDRAGGELVGQTEPGHKVVLRRVIQSASGVIGQPAPNLEWRSRHADGIRRNDRLGGRGKWRDVIRVEALHTTVEPLFERGLVFPAHPQVQRQLRRDFPIVLRVQAPRCGLLGII